MSWGKFFSKLLEKGWEMWGLVIALPASVIGTALIFLWRSILGHQIELLSVVLTGLGILATLCLFIFCWKFHKSKRMLEKFWQFLGGRDWKYNDIIFRVRATYDKEVVYQFDAHTLCPVCKSLLRYAGTNSKCELKCDNCSFTKQLDCSGYDFTQSAQNSFHLRAQQWEENNA